MTVKDIYLFIDSIAPFSSAEEWDNVGLLIGNSEQEVKKAVVSLDCDTNAVKTAKEKGAQLIITHHPVIFDPLSAVDSTSLAWQLADAGISVISAHTNLDKAPTGVNYALAQKLNLDAKPVPHNPFLWVGIYTQSIPCDEWVDNVKKALNAPVIRALFSSDSVKTVALCSGSGGDLLREAKEIGADTLMTGDVKHNFFVEAARLNMNLVDAGHFHTENIIVSPLREALSREFPSIDFIPAESSPFSVY